jgi:cob(I)alamin adenosyltransferase
MSPNDPLTPPEQPQAGPGRKAPAPKKKRPGQYRVPPRDQRHGLVILNVGEGKGKTTAALGVLLRATGRGMRVGMFQFVKSMSDNGEHRTARRLGMEIIPLGDGCTPGRGEVTDAKALAQSGWNRCATALANGDYDVLILDELTLPLAWSWVRTEAVVDAIRSRARGTHVIVTGRAAPHELTEMADLITDMRMIKHPFSERGLTAQAGIDV